MTLPSWEIGRALGIPIRVHASWFLVFVFVTWTLATEYLPGALPGLSDSRYWGMGAAAALLLARAGARVTLTIAGARDEVLYHLHDLVVRRAGPAVTLVLREHRCTLRNDEE